MCEMYYNLEEEKEKVGLKINKRFSCMKKKIDIFTVNIKLSFLINWRSRFSL